MSDGESERVIFQHVDAMEDEDIEEKLEQYRQLDRDFSDATGLDRLGDEIPTREEMKRDGMAFIGSVPVVVSSAVGDNDE